MKSFPLDLNDLSPKEATFALSERPGQTLTLCRWSLRVRAWAQSKYTDRGLQEIFTKQHIVQIGEMAWFMLKEKESFKDSTGLPSLDAFMDCVCTTQDQINLIKALLGTVGIGEPEIEKINQSLPKEGPPSPNPESPSLPKKKKTGGKSSTP